MKHQWPDADPPDKTNPYWEFDNNLNLNGTQYHKVEVEPGKWQWTVNQESMRRMAEHEQHRRDLYWALRSRVLTNAEMAEVAQYGKRLNIESGVSYSENEKARELNDALLQQLRLRVVVASVPIVPQPPPIRRDK